MTGRLDPTTKLFTRIGADLAALTPDDLLTLAERDTLPYWRLRHEWYRAETRRRRGHWNTDPYRLPFHSLARFAPVTLDENYQLLSTAATLARRTGIERKLVHRWQANGYVTLRDADRAAHALRLHPAAIWGDTWWCVTALKLGRADLVEPYNLPPHPGAGRRFAGASTSRRGR